MRSFKPTKHHRAHAAVGILVLLAMVLSVSQALAEMLSVNADELNFREGPSKEHDVIYVADRYFPVKVLERRGKWVYAEDFEGDKAWVAGWLLSEQVSVVVKTDQCNVREKPSRKAAVLEQVARGVAFRVMKRQGSWIQVGDDNGVVGWIHRSVVWGC